MNQFRWQSTGQVAGGFVNVKRPDMRFNNSTKAHGRSQTTLIWTHPKTPSLHQNTPWTSLRRQMTQPAMTLIWLKHIHLSRYGITRRFGDRKI